MKCPKCSHPLEIQNYEGIEVNACKNCGGMWFDYKEVDELEDRTLDKDEFKNSMITHVRESTRKCPVCSVDMKQFNYRWEDLELEMCPKEHGFWLDKGEEKRITEIIEKRMTELDRKYRAEEDWRNHLRNLQSRSFLSSIKKLFK